MSEPDRRTPSRMTSWLAGGLLLIAFGGIYSALKRDEWRREWDQKDVDGELVCNLGKAVVGSNWVGDITELYRRGIISREIAEADTAPLRPLVDQPRPFHGYYVRMMESTNSGTVLKGRTTPVHLGDGAFCIYPAQDRPDLSTWIVTGSSIFKTCGRGNKPILKFPSQRELQMAWAIVD